MKTYLVYSCFDGDGFHEVVQATSEDEALDKLQKHLGLTDEEFARDDLNVAECMVIS